MRKIRFEDKEYDIRPIGLRERSNLIKKYSEISKRPDDVDLIDKVYSDIIETICNKTDNVLKKDYVMDKANEDATLADSLISQFMDLMVGDVSKKN